MSTLVTLFTAFFKIGAFSFGGGYAMLPLIEREVVTTHHWITASKFVDIVAISQVTPGPVAINMATYVGHDVYGVTGSAMATIGVVLPSMLIVLVLAYLFLKFRSLSVMQALFAGIRPAVVALLVLAAYSVFKSSVPDWPSAAIAVGSLALIRFTKLNPMVILGLGGLAGIVFLR